MSEVTVEDRVLIRDLYDRFYMALNDGDEAVIKASFAPGGHVARYDGAPSTPEFSVATGQLWAADPVGRTYQHLVTNVVVDPDPEGRPDFRLARMYFTVTGVWDPPHVIIRWGCKAKDVLQRIDGRWVFVERQISLNHDATGTHWDNEPPHPDWDFETNTAVTA
jgi:SnoaL-like domain